MRTEYLYQLLSFSLKLLSHLLPLVTKASAASGPSGSSWRATARSRPSTSPSLPRRRHLSLRSLRPPPSPGRAPSWRPSTPTWTPPPAPWPRAAARPRWARAPRRRRARLASTGAGSLLGSPRPRSPCRPRLRSLRRRLCRPALSPTALSPRLPPAPQPLWPPGGPCRTCSPLASPSPSSRWALVAASAWRCCPAAGSPPPPQALEAMPRRRQWSKVGGRWRKMRIQILVWCVWFLKGFIFSLQHSSDTFPWLWIQFSPVQSPWGRRGTPCQRGRFPGNNQLVFFFQRRNLNKHQHHETHSSVLFSSFKESEQVAIATERPLVSGEAHTSSGSVETGESWHNMKSCSSSCLFQRCPSGGNPGLKSLPLQLFTLYFHWTFTTDDDQLMCPQCSWHTIYVMCHFYCSVHK